MSKLIDDARSGDTGAVSDRWLELLEGQPPYEEMSGVFEVLLASGIEDFACQLLEITIDEKELEDGKGFQDFLKRCASSFHHCEPLRKALLEMLRDEHLMFQPLEHFLRISGLGSPGADVALCWSEFRGLMRYRDGGYIYHGTFGTGRISRISRTHVTIDFPGAHAHDMKLEVALETTVPLGEESLAVLAAGDAGEFRKLIESDPGQFLERFLKEPFVEGGSLSRTDLAPLVTDSGPSEEELWKMLKKAASSAGGFADVGGRVVALDEGVEILEQLRGIIAARKVSVSRKVTQVQALLRSFSGRVPGDLTSLLPEVTRLKSPETGSLFELTWILTDRGRGSDFPKAGIRFLENSAARAERALAEMHSQSCRKEYVRLFLAGSADEGEKVQLLSSLRRTLWEHSVRCLEETDPELLSRCISLFLSRPSETDIFLWSLAYLATGGEGGGESGESGIELFLDNLIFATADTQKKIISLLMGPLRSDLGEYLDSIDTRKLGRYLDGFDSSATAHKEGLFLAIGREVSRRRSSGMRRAGGKHFWETGAVFSSREAIRRRGEEIQNLRQVDIPAAAEAIGEAASHGDLSENAEYAAAMEKRDLLLDRLKRWTEEQQNYKPYPESEISSDVVSPGIRVTLQETDGSESVRLFEVVGPLDADPDRGRINYMAPLGRVLLGLEQGDTVELPGEREGEWRVVSLEIMDLVGS